MYEYMERFYLEIKYLFSYVSESKENHTYTCVQLFSQESGKSSIRKYKLGNFYNFHIKKCSKTRKCSISVLELVLGYLPVKGEYV